VKSSGAIIPGSLAAQAPAFLSAVVLGSLVVLSRVLLQKVLGAQAPFILAWLGILLAAFMGGFWPAIIVTALGLAVAQWARTTSGVAALGPGVSLIYLAFGLTFALAGHMRKRGLRRARDYADRLAAIQSQMVQVARLNAMGEMAGSLTHEINQPLTAIANYLNAAQQLLAREGLQDSRAAELLGKASDQAIRASQIVARVRANVDHGEIDPHEESLSGLIREAVDIAMAGGGKPGLAIRYDFDRDDDRVLVDRIQVQQVVLNLVRNAIEAMAGSPRRELRIGCGEGEPGLVHCFVADTGPGVAPEVAKRLFQPFVTDKPTGMGVGLSISRNIVEAHGGRLWMDANADGGATFHFSLRRPDREAAAT
jgi:C4-dicarboxylate-specific signal transduction histidine kinase